jgi:hypothetical protein
MHIEYKPPFEVPVPSGFESWRQYFDWKYTAVPASDWERHKEQHFPTWLLKLIPVRYVPFPENFPSFFKAKTGCDYD